MNIVIEGIDGSGKTMLARLISRQLSVDYVDRNSLGSGPPKSYQDIVDRLQRYLQIDGGVFDRHTAISQPIYGILRNDDPLPKDLIDEFYNQKPVIIYARCVDKGLANHRPETGEDPEHLASLKQEYNRLLSMYDSWAQNFAHIWYRKYEDAKLITRMVQGAIGR